MISSFIENTSLKVVDMKLWKILNESAFRRIVLACSKVRSLSVSVNQKGIPQQYAALAKLLRNPACDLHLHELNLYRSFVILSEEELSTIATCLEGNTTLKKMSFFNSGDNFNLNLICLIEINFSAMIPA